MNLHFLSHEKNNSVSNFNFMKELSDYLKNMKNRPENGLYQIDRFEGDLEIFAVCQNLKTKEMCNIPKSKIPQEASDAYVLKIEDGSCTIDYEETRKYVKDIF